MISVNFICLWIFYLFTYFLTFPMRISEYVLELAPQFILTPVGESLS